MGKYNLDDESLSNGGGSYLEAGIHGPCYVTVDWENLSPNGTSDREGIAVHVEDSNGAGARLMITVPDEPTEKSERAIAAKLHHIKKAVAPKVVADADDIKGLVDKFAEQIKGVNTKKQPVWVKLRYSNKDFPDFGTGVFIAPYVKGQECPLKTLDNDRMTKREAPAEKKSESTDPEDPPFSQASGEQEDGDFL